MKQAIHPQYNQAKVSCVCGNSFTTGSTLTDIRVEVCSKCHPFFTGTQKLVDTQGQVDKFQKAKEVAAVKKVERAKVLENRSLKIKKTQSDKPTLKDLLLQARKAA